MFEGHRQVQRRHEPTRQMQPPDDTSATHSRSLATELGRRIDAAHAALQSWPSAFATGDVENVRRTLPAVTALPTWPEIDAIVPAAAEYSFVPDKAVWSLFTVSCALATAASAVARFAAIVAGEAVVVVPAGLPEPDVLPRAEVVPVPLDAPVAPAAPVVPFAGVDG